MVMVNEAFGVHGEAPCCPKHTMVMVRLLSISDTMVMVVMIRRADTLTTMVSPPPGFVACVGVFDGEVVAQSFGP